MNQLLLVLLAAISGPPALSDGQITGDVNRLVEIRVDDSPPDGYDVLSQEWLILSQDVDWREYDNGSVIVLTAPPGVYQARWRGQYVDWEAREGQSESRVYTITIRGPPTPPTPPKPEPPTPPTPPEPTPEDTTGDVFSIVIRDATMLTADQSTTLLQLRTWADATDGVQHLEFAPDAVDGDGTPNEVAASYAARIPEGAVMPYGFLVQALASGGATIHWQGEVFSAEQIKDLAKEVIR